MGKENKPFFLKKDVDEQTISKTISNEINLQEIAEDQIPPAYIDGRPYVLIDNEYVPYYAGQVRFLERKIKRLEMSLEYMKVLAEQEEKDINNGVKP